MSRPPAAVAPARILVVEDDRKTADLVALYLRHDGHRVHVEHDGARALARLDEASFDLLVLDVMLPGVSGLELCKRVRAERGTPVVLLTARTTEDDRVTGFELGADDYVCKPFSPRELAARVNALLRRVPPGGADVLRCSDVALDRARHAVDVAGRAVELTPSEFAILEALLERPGRVRTRAELLGRLPGGAANTLDRTVDVHVRNLRRKIEPEPDDPRYVQTIFGVGYRFAVPAP
jgi:DNA-binding response OmpR family regulator